MDFTAVKNRILDVFFPPRCAYCGTLVMSGATLCADCVTALPVIEPPVCLLCGHSKRDCCCKQKKHEFKGVAAPFYYEDALKQAIHRLKFKHLDFVAETLAKDMAETVLREYADVHFDFVTFVPFTRQEKKTRAFNQSELLAKRISAKLGVPCAELLVKLYDVPRQHTLRARERRGNVFGIFDTAESAQLDRATVLLVDDIKTTGATLSECAKMLRLSGADCVYAVTAAITKVKSEKSEDN